jgi:hypothetical protein
MIAEVALHPVGLAAANAVDVGTTATRLQEHRPNQGNRFT